MIGKWGYDFPLLFQQVAVELSHPKIAGGDHLWIHCKKGRSSPVSLCATGDYRSLLYEDCVSAYLVVEVDDVLDVQSYAFMCAVWRIA